MNGTKSNNFLLPKEKEKQEKRVLILKLLVCLLISNIFTFLLATPNNKKQAAGINLRPGYVFLRWPIINFSAGSGIVPVTLMDNKKVVIKKAHLHNFLPAQQGRQEELGQATLFPLEIAGEDVGNLIKHKKRSLTALPYQPSIMDKKKKNLVSYPYELRF